MIDVSTLITASQRGALGSAAQRLLQGLFSNAQEPRYVHDKDCDLEGVTAEELGALWPVMHGCHNNDKPYASALAQAIKRKVEALQRRPRMDEDSCLAYFGQHLVWSQAVEALSWLESVPRALAGHVRRILGEPKHAVSDTNYFGALALARMIDDTAVNEITNAFIEIHGDGNYRAREFDVLKEIDQGALCMLATKSYIYSGRDAEDPMPTLSREETYVAFAKNVLEEVCQRIEDIHAGQIPYQSDAAFATCDSPTIARAAHVASLRRESWFGPLIKRVLPLVCVAPTAAKTTPSQSLGIALAHVVEQVPTVDSLQALREALRVVRHAGLHKKMQRSLKPAERALLSTSDTDGNLVPDLGLDDAGAMSLDFGMRQFSVAFDETLTPYVKDNQGVRLKALPKPLKSDDAEKANVATERYKSLKKNIKAVASFQIARLESAMASDKQWSLEKFCEVFVHHPLLRHLAARLVWAEYAESTPVRLFRIAEDWSFADCNDQACELAPNAAIGLAHVLTAPREQWQALGRVFADYEILQPFKQFGREIYTLGEGELQNQELSRFDNKIVSMGSIMGLQNRGWVRGEAEGASIYYLEKRIAPDNVAYISLSPGFAVYDKIFTSQTLGKLTLSNGKTYVAFSNLSVLVVSELLREFELLNPVAE